MAKEIKSHDITVNAENKTIGRLASEVAIYVRGKHRPDFAPNKIPPGNVIIENFDKVIVSDKKLDTKIYTTTGTPGGLKTKTWRELYDKDPKILFMKVIKNMIPGNKLKKDLMKKIKIK